MGKKDTKAAEATEKTDEPKAAESTEKTEEPKAAEATEKTEDPKAVKGKKANARFRVVMSRDCACGEGEIKAGEELGIIEFTHESAQDVVPLYLVHALGSDLARIEAVEE